MEFKISPFIALGNYLKTNHIPNDVIEQAEKEHIMFTREYIERAVAAISDCMLSERDLNAWVQPYLNQKKKYVSAAVIMAGNIPLVGFLDMMACSVCDIQTYVKYSSKDRVLMSWVVSLLKKLGCDNIFDYQENVVIDCVIATGSNNANRYFNLKFGDIPSVKRGSRSSVAILTGEETETDIYNLWSDIFDYFGLGCRSVSHILVPKGYDIGSLCHKLSKRKITNIHYINAYKQNKALKIMNGESFFDGEYFIATISSKLSPAMGEITFSLYNDDVLNENRDHIQCVVGKGHIPFGKSQQPTLNDWADDVNLFDFLVGRP